MKRSGFACLFITGSSVGQIPCKRVQSQTCLSYAECSRYYCKKNPQPPKINDNRQLSDIEKSDLDPVFEEASEWAKPKKQVSIDQIRTKFAVGHNRAGVILEQLKVTEIVK